MYCADCTSIKNSAVVLLQSTTRLADVLRRLRIDETIVVVLVQNSTRLADVLRHLHIDKKGCSVASK